jgi:ribonuclease P protein component
VLAELSLLLVAARAAPNCLRSFFMLARENRLIRAEDFRSTMRSGRKVVGDSMVIYLKSDTQSNSPRFGFVVSKSVGSAVERNLTKRRLRSAVRNTLGDFQRGQTLVVRALPSIKSKSWQELETELKACVTNAAKQVNK